GMVTIKTGEYEEAERVLQEGLSLARATGHAELVGDLCTDLAALFLVKSDLQQAEAYAREGLALALQHGDRRQVVVLSNEIGIILAQQLSAEAPVWYGDALCVAQEIGAEDSCCLIWINLGDWYFNLGEYARAESCLGEALAIARRLGTRERMSIVL